jgi:tetratricopeptide (TPR) repeat protein
MVKWFWQRLTRRSAAKPPAPDAAVESPAPAEAAVPDMPLPDPVILDLAGFDIAAPDRATPRAGRPQSELAKLLGEVTSGSPPAAAAPAEAAEPPADPESALQHLLDHLAASFDGDIQGFTSSFDLLLRRRRFEAAEAVAALFLQTCPYEPEPLLKIIVLARMQGDWGRAAETARRLREQFPNFAGAAALEVNLLRTAQRREEARAVLAATFDEAAPEQGLLVEACWLALLGGDWLGTLRLAELSREKFPDEPAGYMTAPAALQALRRFDEAASLLDAAEQRFPGASWTLVQRAKLATARGDFAESDVLWTRVREAQPNDPAGYISGARALTSMGRAAEAEAVLEDAASRFADNRELAIQRARLAVARRDWEEADRRWLLAREKFPADVDIAMFHALAPAGRGKRFIDEALARLASVGGEFPAHAAPVMHGIRLRREQGDVSGAEQASAAALARFPDDSGVALECAKTLTGLGRLDEAAARLGAFVQAHPGEGAAYAELADILSRLDRHDEAEGLARTALERLPLQTTAYIVHARVAARRGDAAEARRRWDEALRRFPNDLQVRKGAYGAEQMRLAAAEESEPPPPAAPATGLGGDLGAIFSRFESLGGLGQGCEFGLVQRLAGIEPLGLLRWARMRPENLTAALEAGFEGVGTPEQTELAFYDGVTPDDPEYTVRDLKYGMDMHTFTKRSDIAFDKMYQSTCRRLGFLKTKLLEDFAAAEKIFVYKIFRRNMDRAEVEAIHALLQRYGLVTLLYVRSSDAEHPGGSVEWWGNRLLVGYISHFSMTDAGEAVTPLMGEWTSICTGALALVQAAAGHAPDALVADAAHDVAA